MRAREGTPVDLRPAEKAWLSEYRFLRAFPGTSHDQYLDTPIEAVDWLLHIHDEWTRWENERQEQANRQQG